MTTDGKAQSRNAIVCGQIFTRDDESKGVCTLVEGHASRHIDISGHGDIAAPLIGDSEVSSADD